MKVENILIVGVGGQGSLLASKLLGRLFMMHDYDVKVNEVHGMSQRGGSVVTTVKGGKRVDSPLVVPGECDLLIALEQLEAYRWAHYLRPEGTLVASSQQIYPMPVIMGREAYPEDIPAALPDALKSYWVDALTLAQQAGSARCANVVMLGAASRFMDFSSLEWTQALAESLPQKVAGMNMTAFELGRTVKLG